MTRYRFEVRTPSGKKVIKDFAKASTNDIKRAAANLRRQKKPKKPATALPTPSTDALLSGQQPKLNLSAFQKKAKEKLQKLSPTPTLSLTTTRPGPDPVIEIRLSGVKSSSLLESLGLLAAAAGEAWMESIR